jgi:hypothetical protein
LLLTPDLYGHSLDLADLAALFWSCCILYRVRWIAYASRQISVTESLWPRIRDKPVTIRHFDFADGIGVHHCTVIDDITFGEYVANYSIDLIIAQ